MVREYIGAGMPGAPQNWCVEDAQKWVDGNIRHRGENAPRAGKPKREVDPLLDGPSSPALERYRKFRASMAFLELKQRRGQLLPRDQVHELLVRLAALIRGAGEALQRQFGEDARLLLEEALNDADAVIDRFIHDARSGGPEE